jgi:UDP-glucose 4-epimerase
MKMLLTGGAGFIGSYVLRAYLQEGYEVIVVDDLSTGRREAVPDGVSLYQNNICDLEALQEVFQRVRPNVVSHHAGLVSVRESAHDPDRYMAVNLQGTQNVLRAAQECGAHTFIFASSGGAVYGEATQQRVSEDHPLNPLSPYGESKALAERLLLAQDGRFKMVILRYGNVYGPGQDPQHDNGVIAIFARALQYGEPITIFGDGRHLRDYVFAEDVARANLSALQLDGGGIFNIATGKGRDLLQLGHQISDALGVEFKANFQAAHPYEVQMNVLEVSRAEYALGWSAAVSFEDGLKRTLTWLQEAIVLQHRTKTND